MNREQILAMEPGRGLDALVAEKVMGLTVHPHGGVYKTGTALEGYRTDFHPSTDISAAWEVVEKFETIEVKRFITDKGLWFCEIKNKVWHRSYGKSATEAICKAALLAVLP